MARNVVVEQQLDTIAQLDAAYSAALHCGCGAGVLHRIARENDPEDAMHALSLRTIPSEISSQPRASRPKRLGLDQMNSEVYLYRGAVNAASDRLTLVAGGIARYGSVVEANAHQAACALYIEVLQKAFYGILSREVDVGEALKVADADWFARLMLERIDNVMASVREVPAWDHKLLMTCIERESVLAKGDARTEIEAGAQTKPLPQAIDVEGFVQAFARLVEQPRQHANGTLLTCDEQSLPAEYRDGGKKNGEPLTVKYLRTSVEWNLDGTSISRGFASGILKQRVKIGHACVYAYKELLALRADRTAKKDREPDIGVDHREIEERARAAHKKKLKEERARNR